MEKRKGYIEAQEVTTHETIREKVVFEEEEEGAAAHHFEKPCRCIDCCTKTSDHHEPRGEGCEREGNDDERKKVKARKGNRAKRTNDNGGRVTYPDPGRGSAST